MSDEPASVAAGIQRVRWHGFAEAGSLFADALRRVLSAAEAAIAARGSYHLVLAGGDTPRALYRSLRDADTKWSAWHFYFGDERCVPREDARRNSRMAEEAWLGHVPIRDAQLHIIPAELGAHRAATAYAQTLQDVGDFDLVLLGLGDDGHTASLFPHHDWGTAPGSSDTLAVLDAPKPPPERVSLSAVRLSRAREVLFMVAGQPKRHAVMRWHAGAGIPARSVSPLAGVDVLVERALLRAGFRGTPV
jgi:6-phosphogluconolactonase